MKKNIPDRFSAILLSLILLLCLLPAGAHARELELSYDGGYYLNMPPSNDHTLDLTEQSPGFSFTLYDNGGANGDYTSECDCTLLITAPSGCILAISGEGNAEAEQYDYLILYDGDTETTLGEGKYSSEFIIPQLLTTGNELKVRFVSDTSIIRSGFALTVTVIDPDDSSVFSFFYEDEVVNVTLPHGREYALPSFGFLFELPDRKIFIGWQSGSCVYSPGCSVGTDSDTTFTAVISDMPVLIPDGEGGFYSLMPLAVSVEADLSVTFPGFTLTVYDNGGPDGNYADNTDGILLIRAPRNCVLRVSGSGVTEGAEWDYLTLFDGDTETALGSGRYCGEFTVDTLFTTGSVLKIYFHSDSCKNYGGFKLTVTVIDPSDSAALTFVRGGESKTVIQPKGFPFVLPACESLFAPRERETFSGWRCGAVAYQPGDSVDVTGNMTFTAIIEDDPVLIADGEGGWYALMPVRVAVSAELSDKSPGFSFTLYDDGGPTENYSNTCESVFTVTAPDDCVVTVSGSGRTEMTISGTVCDYLVFRDGDGTAILGDELYSGDFTVPTLTTSGSVLIVRFHSDNSAARSGFALTVTIKKADAIPGDVNGDGIVTISDVTALLDALSGQGEDESADCDLTGDDNFTIADVTAALDLLSEPGA